MNIPPEWHLQSLELSGAIMVGGISIGGEELSREDGGSVYYISSCLKPESRIMVDVSRRNHPGLVPAAMWGYG